MAKHRWRAVVIYRTNKIETNSAHTYEFSEIADLHDIIEAGPHFDTIIEIRITRINTPQELQFLTIEQAAKL